MAVQGWESRCARALRMLHLPPRCFWRQKAASARHMPAGHRKAHAAAFCWYCAVIRAHVDSLTYPVTTGRKKKRNWSLRASLQFAFSPSDDKMAASHCLGPASCTARPGPPWDPAGKTPREGFCPLANQFAEKSCQGRAGPHFPPQQPTGQAVAAWPVTMEMAAAPRLCLSLPPLRSPPLQGALNTKYSC